MNYVLNFCQYARFLAQAFHFCPDVFPVHRAAASRDENAASRDFLFPAIAFQHFRQRTREKYHPRFPFGIQIYNSCIQSFHRNILKLADPNSSGTYRLYDTAKPVLSAPLRRLEQSLIFLSA